MVMPASCDGAATRVTVLSSQPLPLTTRASITFSQLEIGQSARFDP